MKQIDEDIHIQDFVTPTCPYCPAAVRVAHQMAREHSNPIKADVIERPRSSGSSRKYEISAVLTVLVNEELQFEGAMSGEDFADHLSRFAA